VVFPPELGKSLFGHMVAAIRGTAQYRRASFLLDAVGRKIYPDFVEVDEEPHLHRAMGSAPFDAEGVETRPPTLVSPGVKQGFVVAELLGQGVNIVTGDYSRGAAGFWVENGEIAYPVNEVTIAGNLAEMFSRIAAIGSDVDVRGTIRCGSVLVDGLTVAGQ